MDKELIKMQLELVLDNLQAQLGTIDPEQNPEACSLNKSARTEIDRALRLMIDA